MAITRRGLVGGLLAAPEALGRRDRFGGCPDIRFERSGFFRLERMFTPAGKPPTGAKPLASRELSS